MDKTTKAVRARRSPNFNNDESLYLMHCVAKYKKIVECKKTDGITWAEKDAAWDKITREFNANAPAAIPRNKETLKKLYTNKKAHLRKVAAKNIQEQRATGGGTFIPKTDPCLDILMNITNKKTVEGLYDEFGGDATQELSSECIFLEVIDNREPDPDSVEQDFHSGNTPSTSCSYPYNDHSTNETQHTVVTSPPSKAIVSGLAEASSSSKRDWTNYKGADLRKAPNGKLNSGSSRRRPKVIQPVHTNELSKQYAEVAALKKQYLNNELRLTALKERRDEEEFLLRKRSLELDIEIKRLQLKKLKQSFDFE